jgi:dihydroneopterin aldolase/2-amino-4-hydroxy-6-hydroxymethyldihydropteridine diphosphokinase/dihydropteroate synthase
VSLTSSVTHDLLTPAAIATANVHSINPHIVHPTLGLLSSFLPSDSSLVPIIPFPYPAKPLRLDRTHVMQIFNATPDSFSDGDPSRTVASTALAALQKMFDDAQLPTIIDIGGMSTRPNAPDISESEEISRVCPLIRAIRILQHDHGSMSQIAISVDTFRPNVARAAIAAGASMINDVHGAREEGMGEAMAELGVPVVLMHSRGDSTSMLSKEMLTYPRGVVQGVMDELGLAVKNVRRKGVRRWNILLDPGLGFAKSHADSLALLRDVGQLSGATVATAKAKAKATGTAIGRETETETETPLKGYPLVVGGSRKRFVGATIGVEDAAERGWGDAGWVGWCATQGVEVVRVHESRMGEVVRMVQGIKGGV